MTSQLEDDDHYVTWRAAVAKVQAEEWQRKNQLERLRIAFERDVLCGRLSRHLPGARTIGACYRCLARVR